MKYLMLVLAIFVLSACEDEEKPIDAKYLVMNDCKSTSESFETVDKVWVSEGRIGYWKEQTNRYYVYVCQPGNVKTLSLVKVVVDKSI